MIAMLSLSELSSEADRVRGLELGADDYLTRPCSPRELRARINAIRRRAALANAEDANRPQAYGFAGWVLEIGKRQLRSPDGTLLPLTSGEFDLLLAFVEHPQRVLSRDQLLDLTRGRSSRSEEHTSELQSLMRISYDVFCLQTKIIQMVTKFIRTSRI